jgi:hypothetical protein
MTIETEEASMYRRLKPILAVIAAVALTGIGVATASAARLEIINWERGFRLVWARMEFEAPGLTPIRCAVTLEGSFHRRTLEKTEGILIGNVTRAIVQRPCTNGEAWSLNGTERATSTLPWPVLYELFSGTLPRINLLAFRILGAAFLISASGIGCLYRSTVARALDIAFGLNEAGGNVRQVESAISSGIEGVPLSVELTFFCPRELIFAGVATPTVLSETAKIRFRLIE